MKMKIVKRCRDTSKRSTFGLSPAEILENIPDAIYAVDADSRLTYINHQAEALWSRRREELLGTVLWDMFPEPEKTVDWQMHQKVAHQKVQVHWETFSPNLQVWFDSHAYPTGDGGIAVCFRDITERKLAEESLKKTYLDLKRQVLERSTVLQLSIEKLQKEIEEHHRTEEALRQSREDYKHVIQYSPTAIYEIDFSTLRFKSVNDIMCVLSGYSEAELLSMDPFILLDEESKQKLHERTQKMLAGEEIDETVEYRVIAKDGREIWVVLNLKLIYHDGNAVGALIVAHDITERKKVEQALQESEARYRALFQSIDEGFCIIEKLETMPDESSDFRFLSVNPAFLIHAGVVNVEGKTIREVFPEEPKDWVIIYDTVLRTGEPIRFEHDFITHGRVLELFAFRLEEGKRQRIAVIFMDITQRKRAEEVLHESAARTRAIFEQAAVGMNIVDLDGHFIQVNQKLCDLCGYTKEEMFKLTFKDITYPEDLENDLNLFNQLMKGQIDTYSIEKREIKKDHSIFWISLTVSVVRKEGVPLYFIGVVEDISERKRAQEALKESQSLFNAFMDSNPAIAWMKDEAGRQVYMNQTWEKEYGLKKEDYLGTTKFVDQLPIELAAQLNEVDREVLRTGKPIRVIEMIGTGEINGSRCWQTIKFPIHSPSGQRFTGGMAIEITDYERAKEALRESEETARRRAEELEILMDLAPMAIWVSQDSDCRSMFGNKAANLMYESKQGENVSAGTTNGEVVNNARRWFKNGRELKPEELPMQMAAVKGEDVLNFEMELLSPSGRRLTMLGNARPLFNDCSEVRGCLGVFIDITERKRAEEEALASERELLKVTLESLGEGVVAIDREGFIIFINETAVKLIGCCQTDVVGKRFERIFRVWESDTCKPVDLRVPQQIQDHLILAGDLSEIPVLLNCSPIKALNGQMIGTVVVFQDISERIKIEQELLKAEKLESLGILAGGIAHDFNNILQSILASVQLAILKIGKKRDILKYLSITMDATRQASELTRQLLTFAKGGAPMRLDSSLTDLIQDITEFVLLEGKCKPEFRISGDLWLANIDVSQISQVISNLVINAQQAMADGGLVFITAENISVGAESRFKPGNYIKITVEDHGIGIPKENLGRIFDPFYTTKAYGNGLGLASSYSIIKQHEGFIDVESREGVGTTFFIYLPAIHN